MCTNNYASVAIPISYMCIHRKSHEEKYNELDTEGYEEYTVDEMNNDVYNPMIEDDHSHIEGSSGLNSSTPCTSRDTVGYKRYRYACNVVN